MSISAQFAVQTPDFEKLLLSSSQSFTQKLDAIPNAVCEISGLKRGQTCFNYNFEHFLTMKSSNGRL